MPRGVGGSREEASRPTGAGFRRLWRSRRQWTRRRREDRWPTSSPRPSNGRSNGGGGDEAVVATAAVEEEQAVQMADELAPPQQWEEHGGGGDEAVEEEQAEEVAVGVDRFSLLPEVLIERVVHFACPEGLGVHELAQACRSAWPVCAEVGRRMRRAAAFAHWVAIWRQQCVESRRKSYVGRRVSTWWDGDNMWRSGVIVRVTPSQFGVELDEPAGKWPSAWHWLRGSELKFF